MILLQPAMIHFFLRDARLVILRDACLVPPNP